MNMKAFDGTLVILSDAKWRHIILRHPEVEAAKLLIPMVVASPDEVYMDITGEIHALKRVNKVSDFLVVIYNVNGEGYIRTAHYTSVKRKIRRYKVFKKLKPS
jgi:hypothetical protein